MSEVESGLPPLFDNLLANATTEPVDPSEEDIPDELDDSAVRTRKPRSDKGKPRGPRTGTPSRGRTTSDKKLAEDLLNPWAKAIKAVAFPMPTMAAVMTQQGELTMNALVALASPKMKAALTKVSRIGPGADLIEAGLMMFIAGAMDLGAVKPNTPVAIVTGVQNFYDMVHPPVPPDQQFGPPEQQGEPVPSNVHPFPGVTPEYPTMNGSMFTSYPGTPVS